MSTSSSFPTPLPFERIKPLAIASLMAVATPAVYFGGCGLYSLWESGGPAWWAFLLALSCGCHAAWLSALVRGRSLAPFVPALLLSTDVCRRGLATSGFSGSAAVWAVVLETTLAALALQLAPPLRWPDRLAAWRRACEETAAQLRLARGILPCVFDSVTRLGRAHRAGATETQFADLAAAIGDMDVRLGRQVAPLVMPEHVRQSLLTRAHALATEAELASIEVSMAIEQQALTAAVAFRDECTVLEGLDDSARDALVRGGQAFLLEVAAKAVRTGGQDGSRRRDAA